MCDDKWKTILIQFNFNRIKNKIVQCKSKGIKTCF